MQIAHAASISGAHVTISIGVAQLRFGRITHFDALFEAADQALYRAKENGRNRIEASLAAPQSGMA